MSIEKLIPSYLDEIGYDIIEILFIKKNNNYFYVCFMDGTIGIMNMILNIDDIKDWIESI